MNKYLPFLLCVIVGIIIELLFYYIMSAFEDETHVIIGISSSIAGMLGFISFCGYLGIKNKQSQGMTLKGNVNTPLYVAVICITVILTALVLFAKSTKDEHEEYEQQKLMDRWEQVSKEMDNENELAIKAKSILSQAKSHQYDAAYYVEYISDIEYSSVLRDGMNSEIEACNKIMGLNVYFDDVDKAQTYYNEGRYEDCIQFSKTALKFFQDAQSAYIGYKGRLDRYKK